MDAGPPRGCLTASPWRDLLQIATLMRRSSSRRTTQPIDIRGLLCVLLLLDGHVQWLVHIFLAELQRSDEGLGFAVTLRSPRTVCVVAMVTTVLAASLPVWVDAYTRRRRHAALAGQTPMSVPVNKVEGIDN